MPNTLAAIRDLPNYELYQLKLVHNHSPAIIVAVLTQKAIDLGVRFDDDRKDYRFNLSRFLGNDNGFWITGSDFETSAENIHLDLSDRRNRCLVADLCKGARDQWNRRTKYSLDDNLGLVDYFHPKERETYFRLGVKPRNSLKRTLVLCFDGTSNQFSHQNTNVVKFFEILKKDDPEQQMVYYQTGVGTYTSPAVTGRIAQSVAKTADLGIAWYLFQHVIDGYKFLMETYRAGDHIYIFGFSRGAYTARALAGMLHCVGLLPRHNIEHVPFAYEIYKSQSSSPKSNEINPNSADSADERDPDEVITAEFKPDEIIEDTEVLASVIPDHVEVDGNPSDIIAPPRNPLQKTVTTSLGLGALGTTGNAKADKTDPDAYKQAFCTPVVIDFVGVWDTVGSVGAVIPQTLPFIDYNPSIRIFRQALALDEHRANFVPSLWDHGRTHKGQDIREVWFRGQHTDVGGGAPPPSTATPDHPFTALSNISLRWMVQQCLENKTTIVFDYEAMALYRQVRVLENRRAQSGTGIYKDRIRDAGKLASKEDRKIALERATREAREEAQKYRGVLYAASSALDKVDIKHTPYEAAGTFSAWNFLELLPSSRPAQTANGPMTTHKPNLWNTRMIYRRKATEPVFIHASVKDFLLTPEGRNYVPKAIWQGFNDGDLPPIESYEENVMDWPQPGLDKDTIVAALNMNWKTSPGWGERLKSSVTSFGSKIGRFIKLG